MEHDLWATALLNQFLPGVATSIQSLAGIKVEDPAHPWANWAAMEVLVTLIILALFPILRAGLSVDRPGKFQQVFELLYGFLHGQAEENHVVRFLPYFGTVFIFVLFSNLLGVIPTLESPTMYAVVPCGIAICTFFLYHIAGIREHGAGKYLAHFAGPIPWVAPLMVPIELISHCARPLSLCMPICTRASR
jgi:F-type H+-transporting ATPase subunit a